MNFARNPILASHCLAGAGESLGSGEDGPTEEAIPIPEGQISMWLSKWEMECQVLTDGDSLSDAGPPITAIEFDSPAKAPALPESIQSSGKPVGDEGESTTGGSHSHDRDPQG